MKNFYECSIIVNIILFQNLCDVISDSFVFYYLFFWVFFVLSFKKNNVFGNDLNIWEKFLSLK